MPDMRIRFSCTVFVTRYALRIGDSIHESIQFGLSLCRSRGIVEIKFMDFGILAARWQVYY